MDFHEIIGRFLDLYNNNLTLFLGLVGIILYLIAKSLRWAAIFILIVALMVAIPSTYGLITQGDVRGVLDALFGDMPPMPKPR